MKETCKLVNYVNSLPFSKTPNAKKTSGDIKKKPIYDHPCSLSWLIVNILLYFNTMKSADFLDSDPFEQSIIVDCHLILLINKIREISDIFSHIGFKYKIFPLFLQMLAINNSNIVQHSKQIKCWGFNHFHTSFLP